MTEYFDCYIRVSTQEQTKGFSLDTQEEVGRKLAKEKGLKFRLRNEGGRSSTIHYRPVLEELKDDIEKGLVKHLWVYDRSRLFRSLNDSLFFRKDFLDKFKVSFYEGILGNEVNFDSLEEKLAYDLISQLQEYENEKRSQKSKQGKRHLLQRGVSNRHYGGTVLFGYKSESGVLSIDEENSKWVLFMFDSVLEGKSVMEIKQALDRSGIAPPRTRNGLWNLGTIQKILSNRAYIGEQVFFDKELQEQFTYAIDPIVSRSTFLKVRSEMERRTKIKDNNKKHFTLFGDFLECECGHTIGSEVKVGVRKNGKAYDSRNYHCTSKTRKWKYGVPSNCLNTRSMRIELTDDFLMENIKKVVGNSHLLKERFKTDVLSQKNEKDRDLNERTKKLEDKCKRILKRQEKTYENIVLLETDVIQGRREEAITREIIKKLKSELQSYKDEIVKTELEISSLTEERVWVNWLKQYGDELKTKIADGNNKSDWLNGLIKKITVHPVINETGQVGHKFDILFHLKVVRDKFEWTDKTTTPRKYEVLEGSNRLTTKSVDLKMSRGKKKESIKQNDTNIEFEHSSKPINNRRVGENSLFFSEIATEIHLCFTVTTQFNNLLPEQNPTRYSEEQSQMFDLVKSLKDSGLGYRKVAQELNNRGLTTHTGQEWSSAYVYAVILRHEQRIERQNHREKTYPLIYSKMWIE